MENSGGSGVGPVRAAYCLETSLGLGPRETRTAITIVAWYVVEDPGGS